MERERALLDILVLFPITAALCWLAVKWLIPLLIRYDIVDQPKWRGLHDQATPRGGGMAIAAIVTAMGSGALWFFTEANDAMRAGFIILVIGAPLALLHLLDDRRGIPASWRLAGQTVAVLAGLFGGTLAGSPSGGFLPPWLEWPLVALAWLWFINASNFLDGSDGFLGSQMVVIAGTLTGFSLIYEPAPSLPIAILLGGACLGFLGWNLPRARVFLGDSGAIWLGFVVGWLLLDLAGRGFRAGALILPAFLVADATITLLWRIALGAQPWQAHGNHFVQRVIKGGWNHLHLLCFALTIQITLAFLALLSPLASWLCLITAGFIVLAGLGYLEWRARRGGASLAAMEAQRAERQSP